MNINFEEICRLCLRFCEQYVDLSQTNGIKTLANDLVEKIKYCYVVQIELSEGLPSKICYECIQVLSFFYTAKKNVLISEQLLKDVLFVKRKLREETQNYKETITPDIIEIKQDSEKVKPLVVDLQEIDMEKSDQNSVSVIDVEINYSGCVTTSRISATPTVNVETGNIVSDTDNTPISIQCDSKLESKKKLLLKTARNYCVRKHPNTSNDLDSVLNLKDSKQSAGPSRRPKGLQKMALGINPPSRENIEEIRATIDTRNILSADVKRSRKM